MQKKNILLAVMDDDDRDEIRGLLTRSDNTLIEARSMATAVNAITQLPISFDAIVASYDWNRKTAGLQILMAAVQKYGRGKINFYMLGTPDTSTSLIINDYKAQVAYRLEDLKGQLKRDLLI